MKLSKTMVAHPVKVVRQLLGKSQPKFGKLFGKSGSTVQAVELGSKGRRRPRRLTNEFADAISLRYGLDPESLKQKGSFPRSVIFSWKMDFRLGRLPSEISKSTDPQLAKIIKASEDYTALLKASNKYKRLHLAMQFWQKYILDDEQNQWLTEEALSTKLSLLVEAAKTEDKYYPVVMRLSRSIEDVAGKFRLRAAINAIRKKPGRARPWPSFVDSLGATLRVVERNSPSRKR
jgi:hypothetical protein